MKILVKKVLLPYECYEVRMFKMLEILFFIYSLMIFYALIRLWYKNDDLGIVLIIATAVGRYVVKAFSGRKSICSIEP